jgi:hypothetical protein
VAIGRGSLDANTTASNNTAVGHDALTANSTGTSNVAVGTYSLQANTTASNNTAMGYGALILNSTGAQNTAFGNAAGDALTTGNNNTMLGYQADAAAVDSDNSITLGNSSIAAIRCQVQSISALSDERDKTEIVDLTQGLDFVNDLRPVQFEWNMRDGGKVGIQDFGFIAQDLDETQQKHDAEDHLQLVLKDNPEKLEAAYGKLVPVLVKAVQELSDEVKFLKEKLNERT